MIAGLERVSSGRIVIGDEDVTNVPPQERDVAMVFQDYALYPHMTVADNLAFGLRLSKMPKAEREPPVARVATTLGLQELLDRKPRALSGGQRQRVAMGRAIVREPKAFLMDEPLSNLDAMLRVSMRSELAHARATQHYDRVRNTRSDRGDDPRSSRCGPAGRCSPTARYAAGALPPPRQRLRGRIIGSPTMNLVEAHVERGVAYLGELSLPLPTDMHSVHGGDVVLGIRPPDFELVATADPDLPRVTVRPEVVEDVGAELQLIFAVNAPHPPPS
jgi:multiple sugar transport system ATP-binding protein